MLTGRRWRQKATAVDRAGDTGRVNEFDPAPILRQLEELRSRHHLEVSAAYVRGQETMADAVIGLIDGCDRAIASIPPEGVDWATGMTLLRDEAIAALVAVGYEPLDAVGARFDPAEHEAVAGLGEYVIECTRRGWRKGEHLLRPAQVVVGALHDQRLWQEEPELRRRRST